MKVAPSIRPAPGPSGLAGPVSVPRRLDQAVQGRTYTVGEVTPDPLDPERARQLEEIGFSPGERVVLIARGFPGGDPLVVRIGQSTFALRGGEAACVRIEECAAAQP